MSAGNLLVMQAGGPTPVINSSLFGIIDASRVHIGRQKIFGCRYGLRGLVQGDLIEIDSLSPSRLETLRTSPGCALGSSRYLPDESDLLRILQHLRHFDIRQMALIGGNGTMRAARMISRFYRDQRYELQIVGIPKTIDNDIPQTDRCPGFASAARFVAQSTRDLAMDIRSLPQPVSIFETLGRDVGWLAAASVLGKQDKQDAPHIICLPEVPFEMDQFLAALDGILRKQSWALIVVAEGIRDISGRPIFETNELTQTDALRRPMPGGVARFLAQAVTTSLKVRCRDEKPGLLGRTSGLHVSLQDRKDAELVGREAVRALDSGHESVMVGLTPLGDGTHSPGCELLPLEQICGPSRSLPAEWLRHGNVPIADEFARYARPLVDDLLEYGDMLKGIEVCPNA